MHLSKDSKNFNPINNINRSRIIKNPYTSSKRLFFSFLWDHPYIVIFSMTMTFVSSLCQTLVPVITGIVLGILTNNGFSNIFLLYCMIIVILGFIYVFSAFFANYYFGITAYACERDIRQNFFDIIQNDSLTFHDTHNTSKLLSTGITEITQLRNGIQPAMRMVVSAIFSILITIVFLSQIKLSYSVLVIIGSIIYFYFAYHYSARISKVRYNRANAIGDLTESSQEIFRGIDVVRELSADEREIKRFDTESQNYTKLLAREGILQSFYIPNLILLLLTGIIFALSLYDYVNNNGISIGNIIIAVGLLITLQRINSTMPNALLNIQAGYANAQRIYQLLNWEDPQPDHSFELNQNIDWKDNIIFENVTFSYNENREKLALSHLSVEIPHGSKVALIGGPGAGKSTFLKLLLRLYDPQEGRILINSVDLKAIPTTEVRKHITRVEQEIFLFTGTIKENIAYARPTAIDAEIIAVAKAVQAHEFITKMPNGYDTMIGERGMTLSGGQRQRIAIARALLANPDILLLDDSVSAVDSRTELQLRHALDVLMANRTSFTVTQRLSTLVSADLIILLEKGSIIAVGKHQDLLLSCSQYRRIFKLLPKAEQIKSLELADGGIS